MQFDESPFTLFSYNEDACLCVVRGEAVGFCTVKNKGEYPVELWHLYRISFFCVSTLMLVHSCCLHLSVLCTRLILTYSYAKTLLSQTGSPIQHRSVCDVFTMTMVDTLFVRKSHRKRGIATSILDYIFDRYPHEDVGFSEPLSVSMSKRESIGIIHLSMIFQCDP